jgi:hypothetical protein
MRRILFFVAATELLAAAIYGWSAWVWFGWRAVGPNSFPGSPDAFFYARSALSSYLQAQGFILGGIPGGVAVALMASMSDGAQITNSTRALQITVALLPVTVLAAVYVIGVSV